MNDKPTYEQLEAQLAAIHEVLMPHQDKPNREFYDRDVDYARHYGAYSLAQRLQLFMDAAKSGEWKPLGGIDHK